MLDKRPIVGVMGSHEKEWREFAEPLGQLLAQRGYHLLTGAGGGVMDAVSGAFATQKSRRGRVIGLYPIAESEYTGERPQGAEFPNAFVEIPILCPLDAREMSDAMPYSRNLVNIMTSDALVFLPGAHGTRNEVSFALRYDKPLVLLGPDDAFDRFPQDPLHTDNIAHVAQFFDDVFGTEIF